MIEGLPSLRRRDLFAVILPTFTQGRDRLGGRLVHFSVQSNHMHMLVEADSEQALARFMAGLKIRIARALNKHLGRRGPLWADRYHSEVLRSPTQVRNSIRYVLNNDLHHQVRRGAPFDLFTSAPYFDGFAEGKVSWPRPLAIAPCVAARSWLMTTGWKRKGLLGLGECPATA